jgi:CDP-glycerol glycerophosphotransferase
VAADHAPLLTVVIPVYGVEPYLAECLDSVLADAPAGSRVEVVAVNDRSPDGCGAILDGYAARDPRVRVVHLVTNVGVGRARNAGVEQARGEYVWFVDSDDWLPPGSVRAVLDRLAHARPDVLLVDHVEVFADGRVLPGAHGHELRDFAGPAPLADRPGVLRLAHSACTKVVRRGLLVEDGLWFSPGWYEDTLYSHRLLLAADRIDAVGRACYCYRVRPSAGSITQTVSGRHFEVFDQYRRLFELLDARPEYDRYRADLFALMVDHYLVIVGNERRVPARLRREFFRRIVRDYRRYRPPHGYPAPGGVPGLKHRLVAHGAYAAYAVLRAVYRGLGRGHDGARRAERPAATASVGAAEDAPTTAGRAEEPSRESSIQTT